MDKSTIIREIRRLAADGGGTAPGQTKFEGATGISSGSWRGKYWRRWGEALKEAGFDENSRTEAHSAETLILALIRLTRKNKRFPTYADLRMERNTDKAFPGHMAFGRLGRLPERVKIVRDFALGSADYADILSLLPAHAEEEMLADAPVDRADGFVYMVKLGKHYKIGKTFSVPRRHREIALELPEKPDLVHCLRTDDPAGIEAYWHTRFANKRTNGEWFALTREDVQAFKKRKSFM